LRQAAIKVVVTALDLVLFPLVLSSALVMKLVRRLGIWRTPFSRFVFNKIGIYPIRDHYYEPLFNPRHLKSPLSEARPLPGIDWNVGGQLALLSQFDFNDELNAFPEQPSTEGGFYFDNPNFRAGDADFLYNMIRLCRPKQIIEVGSGMSTLLAHAAVRKNQQLDTTYHCEHICIEPYEMSWLEQLDGVKVERQIVEEVDQSLFSKLQAGDILFIDSSHVIRPQGDVLCEYLQILPALNSGVFVHVHDIFSPRDYPERWLVNEVRLWNEQYLLEAFLSCNDGFEVVGALNYLKYTQREALAQKCPAYAKDTESHEPGSFWIRKK
jgi:hypothetical protein